MFWVYWLLKLPGLSKYVDLEFLISSNKKKNILYWKESNEALFRGFRTRFIQNITYIRFRYCARNSHAYHSLIPNSPCAFRMNRALRIMHANVSDLFLIAEISNERAIHVTHRTQTYKISYARVRATMEPERWVHCGTRSVQRSHADKPR